LEYRVLGVLHASYGSLAVICIYVSFGSFTDTDVKIKYIINFPIPNESYILQYSKSGTRSGKREQYSCDIIYITSTSEVTNLSRVYLV
jgi:hypothetical protein